MPAPRIVLLNGPPAAGKTTVASHLLASFGNSKRFAVLEHDDFAKGPNRPPSSGGVSSAAWESSLHSLVSAAKTAYEGGMSVLVVVNYGRERRQQLEDLFLPLTPLSALLLPSWETNSERRMERQQEGRTSSIPAFGWEEHKQFHADLVAMAKEGMFDLVLASDANDVETQASSLAELIALDQ